MNSIERNIKPPQDPIENPRVVLPISARLSRNPRKVGGAALSVAGLTLAAYALLGADSKTAEACGGPCPTPTPEPVSCVPTDVHGRLLYEGDHLAESPVQGLFYNQAENPDCDDDVFFHVYGSMQEPESEGWLESQDPINTQVFEIERGVGEQPISIEVPNLDYCWYQVDATRLEKAPVPPYIAGQDMIDYVFVKDEDSCLPATNTPEPTDTPTPEPTDTNTPVPTSTEKPARTHTPTNTPTEAPTDEPTEVPTNTNTPVPADTATPIPTKAPKFPTTIVDSGDGSNRGRTGLAVVGGLMALAGTAVVMTGKSMRERIGSYRYTFRKQ